MPRIFFLISLVLSGLLVSCSGENIYEFEELSKREDYVIRVIVIPKDPHKNFNFQTVFFKTDGYGDILRNSVTYAASGEYKVVRTAVKEYKNAGVTFVPINNVSRIEIKIYDILSDYDVFWQSFEKVDGEITVSYDFEVNRGEIIRD